MIKILTQLLFVSVIFSHTHAQTISEKEIFRLDYKGTADTYNFVRDSTGSNYCYFYRIEEENKTFIISGSSTSDKFDYASPEDVKFDSKGNYYAVTSNYKADYGIDNNFLIVNGKLVKNYDYIESYSSYINKAGEFVFVFKENDLFKLGYYNIENGFRESKGYENIRPVFKFIQAQYGREEESEGYGNADYFYNENGERGFIAIFNGKANIVFETGEIATDYSDINESSIILNRNNELSFIAKRGGRFFEKTGNEFVVSGAKEYDQFELAYIPLQFDKNNDPVYVAGDSISEAKYNYYLVIGNQKQTAAFDNGKSRMPVRFSNFLYDINLNNDGSITYFGIADSMIPAQRKLPEEEAYDQYYSRTYYVKDGNAFELGYNTGTVKYSESGDLLYSGVADIEKNERLLMMNYGLSKIIINKKKYDDIYDYGFSPAKEIYYAAVTNENEKTSVKNMSYMFLNEKLIGKYVYFSYQNNTSILIFDSENKYAFVAAEGDSILYKNVIVTNNGELPFPDSKVAGAEAFSQVSNLMFSKNDKLFYVGDAYSSSQNEEVKRELFVDNRSVGDYYNSISNLRYSKSTDVITFTGSRGNRIYSVTLNF